jgi:hypothetical protein
MNTAQCRFCFFNERHWSLTNKEKNRVVNEEIFEKLRINASRTSDYRLAVRLLAVVACITKDKGDIALALDKARNAKHDCAVAEALAIIVKVLAYAERFDEARAIAGNKKKGIAGEMVGLDPYWHAEAVIWLARISKDEDDHAEAKMIASRIRNPDLRDEVRADLSGRNDFITLPNNPLMALGVIADALSNGKAPHNSGHLHNQVDKIISSIFDAHPGWL